MKEMRSIMNNLVGCGVALAMVSTLAAQTPLGNTPLDGKITVVRITGSARYSVAQGVWKPLKLGQVLQPGTMVQTEDRQGAYVDLVLAEERGGVVPTINAVAGPSVPAGFKVPVGQPPSKPATAQNVVRLDRNTVLTVNKLTFLHTGVDVVSDTRLDLKAGKITGIVKKMSAGSWYEIKLPTALAAVRGTTYSVDVYGNAEVAGGSMTITSLDQDSGKTSEIPSGTGTAAPTTTPTPETTTTTVPGAPTTAPGTTTTVPATPGAISGTITLTGYETYNSTTGQISQGVSPTLEEYATGMSVFTTETAPPVISDLTVRNISQSTPQP